MKKYRILGTNFPSLGQAVDALRARMGWAQALLSDFDEATSGYLAWGSLAEIDADPSGAHAPMIRVVGG